MNTKFSIEFHLTYLLVHHTQDFEPSAETMKTFWSTLASACQNSDCKLVLWIGKIGARRMNLGQIIDSASQAGRVADVLRLACVFENYIPNDKTLFFQTMALRKGARVKYFSTREEALEWLGVDPTTENWATRPPLELLL